MSRYDLLRFPELLQLGGFTMTATQLTIFFLVLVLWVIYALGIFPFVRSRALRRDLLITGWTILIALLLVSLLTTPSLVLWIEYAVLALAVVLALWVYHRMATRHPRSASTS